MSKYLPHHREQNTDTGTESRTTTIFSMILLIIMLAWIGRCTVDAVVRTAENQEQYYSMPVSMTYSRPAAYRKASPTNDQMEAYHHLMQIQEVRR